MRSIWSDTFKTQKLTIEENETLNQVFHTDNRITDAHKRLKGKQQMSDEKYIEPYPAG